MSSRSPSFRDVERIRPSMRAAFAPVLWSRRRSLALAGTMAAASAGLALAGPLVVRRMIDGPIAQGQVDAVARLAGLYLVVQLLAVAASVTARMGMESAGQGVLAELRARLSAHLLRLPMAFHDRHAPGELLARVQSDTEALKGLLSSASLALVGDVLLIGGMVVVMSQISPAMAVACLVVVPPLVLVSRSFHRRTHPLFLEGRRLGASISAKLAELLHGHDVLRAFERRRWASDAFHEVNARKFQTMLRGERIFVAWFQSLNFFQTLSMGTILAVGGTFAISGRLSMGSLALFLSYARKLFEPIFQMAEQVGEIQKGWSAAERVAELLAEPAAVSDRRGAASWPGLAAEIRFEDVWFRYGIDGDGIDGDDSVADDWVIRGVSFTMPAGQRWALVGPTGAGKSTIAGLMLRLYEPTRGRILVDGVDLATIRTSDLRRAMGLVLQDVVMFPGDVAFNVTLGRSMPADQIEDALARVARGSSRTALSADGGELSLGERQLVAFARVLAHDPALLVLDEATSAIDPATEAVVSSAVEELFRGRTALVIAHRLATIEGCDRLLVLEGGRVVQQGSPGELAASEGLYRELHARDGRKTVENDKASEDSLRASRGGAGGIGGAEAPKEPSTGQAPRDNEVARAI